MSPGETSFDTTPQESALSSQLAKEVSRLIAQAATELDKPSEEVLAGVEALLRARGGGLRSHPRFSMASLADSVYAEEGRRFVDRMVKLFKQFIAAYVNAVADNGLASETPSSSDISSPTSSEPATAVQTTALSPTDREPESTPQTTAHSATKSSTQSKNHSSSRSRDIDDDNDDDDSDDDDEEDSDNHDADGGAKGRDRRDKLRSRVD